MVVCNHDIDAVMRKELYLTWMEEWMVYFQWIWGRETTTLKPLARQFKTSRRVVSRVLEKKRQKVLAALWLWPRFASFEEDIALRPKHWSDKYEGRRVIFWDDTNVPAIDPADSETNRHWVSHYYDGCVAKGAVFLQLCGWMGTWQLWAGRISDSDYQE